MADGYSLREVGELLGLSRSIVKRLIDAGFVSPSRGPRREFRFTFHDLVVLRAAKALSDARISPSRILRALKRLRAQLPAAMPLSGLRIEAVGDTVVVSEGRSQWQPDDGQYILRFDVALPRGKLAFIDPEEPATVESDDEWFTRGCALESNDAEAARAAYRRAIDANVMHLGAYINLGRSLHESGRLRDAEAVYRLALGHCGSDGALLFNLAVLLEDLDRSDEAIRAYRGALDDTPDLADAHYNLALLCEAQGLRQEAVRHLSAFRKLSRS